jgi:hypothetical protein
MLTLHFTRRRKGQEIETIYEGNQEWLLGKQAISYQLLALSFAWIAQASG